MVTARAAGPFFDGFGEKIILLSGVNILPETG
jgi:hypothetical protein